MALAYKGGRAFDFILPSEVGIVCRSRCRVKECLSMTSIRSIKHKAEQITAQSLACAITSVRLGGAR